MNGERAGRRPTRGYSALVLAGRRHGVDPLAASARAPHRALVDVGGVPMLERVLQTLVATPCIGEIVVSIDVPELLPTFPGIGALMAAEGGRLVVTRSTHSPSRSVLAVLDDGLPEQPLLVTTADHALLTREMVEYFLAEAEAGGADVSVGLVAETLLRARFPDAQRTYLPFAGERYSGANLFAFTTPQARRAVLFWTRAESFRKRPWRLVATFGPRALARFLRRRLDLRAAFGEVSQSIGARVAAVELPWPEAAVDVDKPADLELVRAILAEESEADGSDGRKPVARGERDDPAHDQSSRSPSAAKPPVVAS